MTYPLHPYRRILSMLLLLIIIALIKGYVPINAADSSTTVSGIASWGDGWTGVVTRLPRGTSILVTGPLGAWTGSSWGYGPAEWTGRIVDLDVDVFEYICGPRSIGLCEVRLAH